MSRRVIKVQILQGLATSDTVLINPDHVTCSIQRVRDDVIFTDVFLSDGQSIPIVGDEETVLTRLGFDLNP